MSNLMLSQVLESGVKLVEQVTSNIQSRIMKAGEDIAGKQAVSVAARMVEMLEKISIVLENLTKIAPEDGRRVYTVAPYFYVIKTEDEVLILRTRPEHMVIQVGISEKSIALKTRRGSIVFTPGKIKGNTRGVSFEVNIDPKDFGAKLNEIRTVLKVFEKPLYQKLLPYVSRVIKK